MVIGAVQFFVESSGEALLYFIFHIFFLVFTLGVVDNDDHDVS